MIVQKMQEALAMSLATFGGVTLTAAGLENTPFEVSPMIVVASAAGALINVLWAARKGGQPIDLAIAGALSGFAGVFLAPMLIGMLDRVIPGVAGIGKVPAAGLVSLLSADLLERYVFKRLRETPPPEKEGSDHAE